jgi:hypothetical protein
MHRLIESSAGYSAVASFQLPPITATNASSAFNAQVLRLREIIVSTEVILPINLRLVRAPNSPHSMFSFLYGILSLPSESGNSSRHW